MKYISSILAILGASAALLTSPVAAQNSMHNTMPQCKGSIVYAVPSQKIYFSKGNTNYGHVKGGSYMCEAAAKSKGYKKGSSSMKSSM